MTAPPPVDQPFVSVVVPTFARPEPVRACLEAMAKLDYPRERFEVIVVDDGSPQPAGDALASAFPGLPLRIIRQRNAGPAAARNRGAAEARGEMIAFTDDDCAPEASWLSAMAVASKENPGAMIGGQTINALPENAFASATGLLVRYLSERNGASGQRFFASNNLAVPARRFRELGGFSTSFPLAAGEDRDFCDRWWRAGFAAAYAPEAVVKHAHAMGLRGYWRQHFNYGRGAARFHAARAAREAEVPENDARQRAPLVAEPLRFYLDLVRYPLKHERGPAAWRSAALLGLAQVANAAGLVRERWRRPRTS